MAGKEPEKKKPIKDLRDGSGMSQVLSWMRDNRQAVIWGAVTFTMLLTVFFVSLLPPQIRLKAGEVSPISVKATHEVIDDAATDRLKQERAKSVPESYTKDLTVLSDIQTKLAGLRSKITELSASTDLSTQDIVKELQPWLSDGLSDADVIGVVATSPVTLDAAFSTLDAVLGEVLSEGLKAENLDKGKGTIRTALGDNKDIPSRIVMFLSAFVDRNLKPNFVFDQEETDRKIREALLAVEPVRVRRGEYIIREGDVITGEQIALLEKLGMMGARVRFSAVMGSFLMSALVSGFIGVSVFHYSPSLVASGKAGLLSSTVILSVAALKGISQVSGFLAPVASGVMLVSTLLDRRLAAVFSACLTLSLGTMTGFDTRYLALSLAGGLTAALSSRPDWPRLQLVRTGFMVSLVNGGVYLSLGLTGVIPLSDLLSWRDTVLVLMNGPLSAVLALGSLPVFEIIFGIITPVRLVELSNPEQPLLHRLMLEAPGTYHHSVMVANLAEAAATAIGADSLLARVGAYYHDVGKLKRPYFFAENQMAGMENPHDKMTPSLSSTVIMAHVKDGLELAGAHQVPEVIRSFIAEHHGTTLASYFYVKASESQARNGRGLAEWDFRYEGPRPASKETAIVMLADGVEAAVRALSKATPARIESVVRKIIQDRLNDHQLDRSDLTLKELDIMADTFARSLSGIFHTRIEYPSKGASGEASGEQKPERRDAGPRKESRGHGSSQESTGAGDERSMARS